MPGVNYISEARKRHTARPEPQRRTTPAPSQIKFHFPWANGPTERPYLFPADSSSSSSSSDEQRRKRRLEGEHTLNGGRKKQKRRRGIRRPPPSVPPRIARPAALEPTAEHRHPWLATPRCRGLFELPRLAENFGRGPGSLNLQAHSLRHLLEDDSVGPARQDMRLNMVRARPEVWHRDAPPSNPAEAAPVSQVDDSEHEFLPDFNMVSHWQDEASLAMPPPSPRRWPVDRPLRPALRYARPVERLEHLAVDLPPGWPSPPRPPPPTTSDGFDDLNDLDDLDPPVQRIKPGYQWQARTVPSALFFQAPSSPAPRPYPPWPPRYDPFQAPPVDQFDSQLSSSPLPTPTPAPRPLTRPPQPASSSTQITTPPAPRQSPRRGCVTTSPRTHNTPSSQLSAYEHAKRRAQAPMYRQR